MLTQFRDRTEAGRRLAQELSRYTQRPDVLVLVLALPRGGVPVAYEVARTLEAPLDVSMVRKLGVPGRGELAMGAVASGGLCVLSDETIELLDDARGHRRRHDRVPFHRSDWANDFQ